MSKRKIGLITLWVSIFFLLTSLVFFVIGCNSSALVNSIGKIIALIVMILAGISTIIAIIILIKNKKGRLFKKWQVWLFSILVSLYVLGCSGFLFLIYGPYSGFRTWLVTTAMGTMHHQYYCKWFYNDERINSILGENYIDDGDATTDPSLVDHNPTTNYKNDYEKEILEHEEGELYKLIKFEVNGCDAYLAAIYDPSKVSVGVSRKLDRDAGQYSYTMAKEQNAILAINGGGFIDPNYNSKGGTPLGVTIANGKIISNLSYSSSQGIIGFNNNNTLVLMKKTSASEAISQGVRDAVTMGPFLIVNGKSSFIKGNGGWGYAARTAIGQRKDGVVLFLVVDSNELRTKGASMLELTQIMERYGAVNAANLDGGTSSNIVVNGELINDPIDSRLRHKTRGIPTIFKVTE